MKLRFRLESDASLAFDLEVNKPFSLPVFQALIVSYLDLKALQENGIRIRTLHLGEFVITRHPALHLAFIRHALTLLMQFYNTHPISEKNDFFL